MIPPAMGFVLGAGPLAQRDDSRTRERSVYGVGRRPD